jgi:hypothetical protein
MLCGVAYVVIALHLRLGRADIGHRAEAVSNVLVVRTGRTTPQNRSAAGLRAQIRIANDGR